MRNAVIIVPQGDKNPVSQRLQISQTGQAGTANFTTKGFKYPLE